MSISAAKESSSSSAVGTISAVSTSTLSTAAQTSNEHRSSWNKYFIEIALTTSSRSTCQKYQVGCVIVKSNRIVSTGYNGVVSGQKHCIHHTFENNSHSEWSKKNEIHAEINAILFAARHGNCPLEGTILYTTHSPCSECAKSISTVGIKEVYYLNEYKDKDGINFLEKLGIHCIQVTVE